MNHARMLGLVCGVLLVVGAARTAVGGDSGTRQLDEPLFDYSRLRSLFPAGHCGFPVKYCPATAKGKGGAPDARLRQEQYHFHLGPLGLKCLMHDRTFHRSGLHRTIFPPVLMDRHSHLAFSCFEVCKVLPGSPAKGKVEVGGVVELKIVRPPADREGDTHRLNQDPPFMKEIRRRTRVVGSSPDGQSELMLAPARLRHNAGTKWGECR